MTTPMKCCFVFFPILIDLLQGGCGFGRRNGDGGPSRNRRVGVGGASVRNHKV